MRAIADGERFCETYFIVMDRLYDTLEKRIATWRLIQERLNGSVGKFLTDRGGKKAKELVLERLIVAFDISSALSYLHERKLIYRDIKVRSPHHQIICP
jgi:serine/threonine protein kinase